ncbi:sigma-70 family RNA polymerase sigma factor [Myxococcota bacterium]|nr:sigma-70 family RNA polymerase sigma factor [Myxococcota bacterium]MBU1381292.1 sigma-70 family RNA polymerase sigma factor [Myxococcota bacterium]MBU1495369.1 sigma-70 family RNA polymerase sigma factor [Myxococcota bacterium]
MAISDDDLIIACLNGDRASAHTLASKYLRVCYSIALSFLNNAEDAEDAAQNAMISALSSLHQLSSTEKFKPWLYQIVRNTSKAHISKAARHRTLAFDEVPDVESENNHTHTSIQRNDLIKAMEKLSKNERQVLLLYDLDGFNHKEIAAFTGFSEENSRQLLFSARKKLRKEIAS